MYTCAHCEIRVTCVSIKFENNTLCTLIYIRTLMRCWWTQFNSLNMARSSWADTISILSSKGYKETCLVNSISYLTQIEFSKQNYCVSKGKFKTFTELTIWLLFIYVSNYSERN